MSKFEINEDAVRKLSELLKESDLSEIEYEHDGHKIRVAKSVTIAAAAPTPMAAATAAAAPVAQAAASGGGDDVPAGAVVSPMVGTVYSAPEPTAYCSRSTRNRPTAKST